MGTTEAKRKTNRYRDISWLLSHAGYYLKLNSHILARGVPLRELLVLKYPFSLPDAPRPPMLSIDITDACDLQCQYCNNPLFPHPRTMMSDEVFSILLNRLKPARINRIRIGGGEPLLHPDCARIVQELTPHCRYLSLITNAQWQDTSQIDAVLRARLQLLEVSVDAGGAEVYESSRRGASYARLIQNLEHLKTQRNKLGSKTLIKIRLMLRPSTQALERQETRFWKAYCDCVLPQLITQHPESEYTTDVFRAPDSGKQLIPRCTIPFKDLQIRPDGNIPACPAKGCSLDSAKHQFLGNIKTDDILSLWKGQEMTRLRNSHRQTDYAHLEDCRGCNYC